MVVIGLLSRYRDELEEITVELELEPVPEADLSSDILPNDGAANNYQQSKDNQLINPTTNFSIQQRKW